MSINQISLKSSLLVVFVCGSLLHAQSIEITIKDSKTGEPIPSVYVVALRQSERFETISNPEGKIKLPVNCDSIVTSHLAYESLRLDGKRGDTYELLLVPRVTELADITIYSTDLREKIEHVLKHFSRFYVNNERTYHCTYKETFRVDDSLVRLLQFNMQWWDKDYESNLKKPYEGQNQVAIDAVSYSRAKAGKTVYRGALTNESFFAALHLNNYLTGLLWLVQDFTIHGIEKTNTTTKVMFDARFEKNGRPVGDFKNCYFVFDNSTNALMELRTQLIYSNHIEEVVSKEENVPVTVKYKNETRTMSFVKEKNKLRLGYFEFAGEHEDRVEDTIYSSEAKLSVYIVGSEKGNSISSTAKVVPLEEAPIKEYIQNTPKKDPTILLTRQEQEFIRGKDND